MTKNEKTLTPNQDLIVRRLKEIFSEGYLKIHGSGPKYPFSVNIQNGQMYDSPTINLYKVLTGLREVFETEDINIDNYSSGGCETCDYGSDYGHEYTIKNLKKNLDALDIDWSDEDD